MKLSGKYIVEIIGILAVVMSLIFVALELRESRIASRAASYQEIGIAVANSWFQLASDAELSAIITKGNSEDSSSFEGLSGEERDRARRYMIGTLRLNEILFLQVQEGLLEEGSIELLGYGEIMGSYPLLRNLWPEMRGSITPEFREYLENDLNL